MSRHAPVRSSQPVLAGFSHPLCYSAGVILFRQGSPSSEVFFIQHGLVKLQRVQQNGEERIIALRSEGWFLGAADAVLGEAYAATAVTLVDSEVMRVSSTLFRSLVRNDTALSWRVHEMHCRELYSDALQVAELTSTPAKERLRRFIWSLDVTAKDSAWTSVRVELPLKHWEIAQLVGVTPQYLCCLFGQLESDGILERNGTTVVLHGRVKKQESAPSPS